ncbi:MAG TPA: stage III sporulation protein AD [Cerasibacillus sp.]|uniref:stage III sporulation protein AD n=1 Tax=Cerasibacillus sp. TaxID=2498711 RepID=UPI002F41BF80
MEIVQLVVIGMIASILYLILQEFGAPIGFLIILVSSILIFSVVIKHINGVFQLIHYLGERASIEGMYIETILKIIGIAYITELGSSLTKDAGLSSIATKIELAGKIFILVISIPIITALLEAIINFLPVN